MDIRKYRIIDFLHISGSIASVTAIALILAEKTIGSVSAAQILGYIASSSVSIAILMMVIMGLVELHKDITSPRWRVISWFGITPIAIFCYIMIVRLIFMFGLGFFSIIFDPI
jgi:hypothetical protein